MSTATVKVKVIKASPIEGHRDMESLELAEYCSNLCLEKKAMNVVILDLTKTTTVAEYFIIASGAPMPQVQTICAHVIQSLKKLGHKPLREEGVQGGRWGLIDLGDIMVHVFQEHVRDFYDLEGLWQDTVKTRVEDPNN